MARFQLIRDLLARIGFLGKDDVEQGWKPVTLPQVETLTGFVPLEDLPFKAQNLARTASRRLEPNRRRLLRAGGANSAEQEASAAASREPFSPAGEGSPQESAATICPRCIEQGRSSRTFVGPVLVRDMPRQRFTDEQSRFHNHDPNLYRLTYVCSNGHRWERHRYKKCWCGYTAEPEGGN